MNLPERIGPLTIIGHMANACRDARSAGVSIAAFKLEEPQAFQLADWLCNHTHEQRCRFEILQEMKDGRARVLGAKVIVKQLTAYQRPEADR